MAEIDNPCYHCYQGAIDECLRCKYINEPWHGDFESETIEIEDGGADNE